MQPDYIVIGAGSAGAVIASRLSERNDTSVLLIEAGDDDRALHAPTQAIQDVLIHIPAGYVYNMTSPKVDWGYQLDFVHGNDRRPYHFSRGKVLGGSSSINGMLYVRGNRADYDNWAALGGHGWSWEEVLPYFIKAENQARGASDVHGVDGPLGVGETEGHPVSSTYLEACRQAGLEPIEDINTGNQDGVTRTQVTIVRGRRQSTAVAYLHAAMKRDNLIVEKNALVTRILVEHGRAVGVEFNRGADTCQVRTSGEVILCAGVIGSPHILQLSGLGPAATLRAAGIDVIADLPGVGENFQEHFTPIFRYRLKDGSGSVNTMSRGASFVRELAKYAMHRTGLLTWPPTDLIGFIRSRPDLVAPDLQLSTVPASTDPQTGEIDPFDGFTASTAHLQPESRGHVRATSPDAHDKPEILLRTLDTEYDREAALAGCRIMRKIADQPALRDLFEVELNPGPDVRSDKDLLNYVAGTGISIYHGSSTCAMGDEHLSVLDADLKVRGIDGLRVADASSMPRITRGNTNAPTIMIGEKASDLIMAGRRVAAIPELA